MALYKCGCFLIVRTGQDDLVAFAFCGAILGLMGASMPNS